MPMIQIEQNSPEVVDHACDLIASMTAGLRETPGELDDQYGRVMHVTGFLAALKHHALISQPVHERLQQGVRQACEAVWVDEGVESE